MMFAQEQEKTVSAIGEGLIQAYNLRTLKGSHEILYYSKDGVYKRGAEEVIETTIRQQVNRNISKHDLNEILYYIQTMTYTDRSEFDKDPDILNLKNGLLNVETGQFREHTPDYLSTVQLPIIYDTKASCPNILRFLQSALGNDEFKVIVRQVGYLLLRSCKYEKAFMNTGIGANGKSTWLKTLKAFLGPDNVSSVSLQELVDDRFAAVNLDGKLANINPDLKAEKLADTGIFKALVSGDRIHVQKKHQNGYSMENYAKLIFSANKLPETSDDSHAFYRRWCIISWKHVFEGAEKDEDLISKLTTEKELSGLLNVALVGLKRLKIEGGFEDTDLEEIRKQYQIGASMVHAFVEKECVRDIELQIPTFALHTAFVDYCKRQGSNFCDMTEFGKKLKEMGIEKSRPRKGRGREYVYAGIALKSGPGGPSGQPTFLVTGNIEEKNVALDLGPLGPSPQEISSQ